jgi:hypothetical protein
MQNGNPGNCSVVLPSQHTCRAVCNVGYALTRDTNCTFHGLLLKADCVAAEYVSQTVKVGSITHADNYTGTLKFVMEAGYAYSMGIMEGTGRLEVGYSLTSTARSARRAGIEIKYLITSPPRFIQTLLTQTKAFSIADLVMNIAMVKTQIGQATLSVPTASDVSSLGGGDYLAGPTTSPTPSPTAAPTALPDKELMGLPLATLVYGLLTLVLLMCLCCWIYFYCVWSIEWVQQTRSPEHKEQRRAKRGSQLELDVGSLQKIELVVNLHNETCTNKSAYL